MPLLQLPAEILFQIFAEVGASYFRSDVSRLTVCKLWSNFAQFEFYRELYATHKTVHSLLTSSNAETTISLIKANVESLELCLDGFEYWEVCKQYPDVKPSHLLPLSVNILDLLPWNPHYDGASRGDPTMHLLDLVKIVKNAPKLRTLGVYTFKKRNQDRDLLACSNKLSKVTLCFLLSNSNLTSLELDLVGADLDRRCSNHWDWPHSNAHLCRAVSELLPTLRCLRVRMPSICPSILIVKETIENLPLSEVIVNLCIPDWSRIVGSSDPREEQRRGEEEHSMLCCFPPYYSSVDLVFTTQINYMGKAARNLAAKMAAPKKVWILRRAEKGSTLQAFDALTGTTIALKAHSLDMPPWGDE